MCFGLKQLIKRGFSYFLLRFVVGSFFPVAHSPCVLNKCFDFSLISVKVKEHMTDIPEIHFSYYVIMTSLSDAENLSLSPTHSKNIGLSTRMPKNFHVANRRSQTRKSENGAGLPKINDDVSILRAQPTALMSLAG